ncbi:Sodium/hydrogen exchanger family-domain-containing protein [Aspergillus pseudonomiae]|uniref:Sodium/hydrogen exchanger family-domain-containing protein n=1 Tax=Aspergillus pseudonomiae TaxID=1506151 RepID=A0A5N6HY41_9EURO|nr:Sodium/hydrogen exchanger family-domain-containing protein [Aspergillus pseudonomiae]KAB8259391.1 Sodium/hydrogen exchanger family-domain-containing protein [Aspergillus pseudonomiae]KAE8408313.1 Sodium/hydrogen exchanger family-domain-containing protein [Aspergillus pseudonomiae]
MGLRQSSPRWDHWTDCNFPSAWIFLQRLSVLTSIISRWPWRPARSSEGKSGGEHDRRRHRGAVETFIIGAALSATSLGTTFAVISSASKTVDLAQTRVGSVLVSAAVIDDVVGLVLSSIISDLGKLSNSDANLGWIIGRPIVASVAMAILTPVVTKFLFAPIFRKYIEFHFARYDHISNIILMTLVLCAFISIAAYTGTSVLFGAFLAGTFLSYLPSKRPDGPFVVMSREEGEQNEDKSPTFVHTFEAYLLGVQTYLMEPLFFASIGFAIPFVQLWTGKRIWRGILYTLLMVVAKFVVGIWIPIWKYLPGTKSKTGKASKESPAAPDVPVESPKDNATMLSALLLGSAMVARGEIGLLIIEIGYNSTEYVSEEGFITGVWAILLNTIIGPVTVGLLVKFYGARIGEGEWGLQKNTPPSQEKGNVQSAV